VFDASEVPIEPFGCQNHVAKPETAPGAIRVDVEEGVEQFGLAMAQELNIASEFTCPCLPSLLELLVKLILSAPSTGPASEIERQANRVANEGGIVPQCGFN
jgi:hypothetical protein